jgi:predicted DNA-binding transcriptional regulator AlpA
MGNERRNEPLLLRGTEVAELIGCSRAMAYRLMQNGVIPVVRVPGVKTADGKKLASRTVRVPAEALREWIKANTTQVAPLRPVAGDLR